MEKGAGGGSINTRKTLLVSVFPSVTIVSATHLFHVTSNSLIGSFSLLQNAHVHINFSSYPIYFKSPLRSIKISAFPNHVTQNSI